MLYGLLVSIGDTAMASMLREVSFAYPLVNTAHILSLSVLVGSIIPLDLRILGVIKRGNLTDVTQLMSRLAAIGLTLTLITGIMLFSVQPAHYLNNSAFIIKAIVIFFAILNVLLVHNSPHWKALKNGGNVTLTLKVTASVSLILWITVVFAGRWIAFV